MPKSQIITQKIIEIRGHKVLLDFDLAELYATETRIVKQAVRRNLNRFPLDFMFELTEEEVNDLDLNDRNDLSFDLDIAKIEELVASDDSIKGIWVVPKYGNPTGTSVADEVVDRLASMKTAANGGLKWDFRQKAGLEEVLLPYYPGKWPSPSSRLP